MKKLVFLVSLLFVLMPIALADTQVLTQSFCGNIPLQQTTWTQNIDLQKYNPSQGLLIGAEIWLNTTLITNLEIEHNGQGNHTYSIEVTGTSTVSDTDGVLAQNNLLVAKDGSVTPYDGLRDYAGTSGATFNNIVDSEVVTHTLTDLAAYTAAFPGETFSLSVMTEGDSNLISDTNNYWWGVMTYAEAEACITYTYEQECQADIDCDDLNPCTSDTCINHICENLNKQVGASCSDGLFCNGPETCDTDGICQSGQALVTNDGVSCTEDSCDEATDTIIHEPVNSACDDGLWCNGAETCDAQLGCQAGTAPVCSQYNLPGISNCNNNPDNNPLTWDYANGFTSTCDELNDECTTSTYSFTYTCDMSRCGAECVSNSNCANKCVGNVYYSAGSCTSGCTCSYNLEDCDSHDGWYDTGETRLVSTGECTQKEQKEQDYRQYSCAQGCQFTITDTRWIDTGNAGNKPEGIVCNDGLWCTLSDVCTAGVCGGAARDCSVNNIGNIATCSNIPDTNPFTWDYRPGFVSVCNEAFDICTIGDEAISHTCNVDSCGAECDATHSCANTECDDRDGCYSGTYRNYADVSNICLSGCTCEDNQCGTYTVIITDNDGDGYDIECDHDCNDNDNSVYPGALETLDKKDNDCNGLIDEVVKVGIEPGNRCPEIDKWDDYQVTTWYELLDEEDNCEYCGLPEEILDDLEAGIDSGKFGRSYAFEGEQIWIKFGAEDQDGVIDECTQGYMTVDCQSDPKVVQCTKNVYTKTERDGLQKEYAIFECNYFVGGADEFQGECWISVSIEDECQQGCSDVKPGIFSVYLNPAVGISYSPQASPGGFGFKYNEAGDLLQYIVNGEVKAGPKPGDTAYTPFFTIENSADAETGLYMLLQIYGTDFVAPLTADTYAQPSMCDDTKYGGEIGNKLSIENIKYLARHLNVDEKWYDVPAKEDMYLIFREYPMASFLGVGDDITMRLKIEIPSICEGSFTEGGEVMFVATVI